jgi:hypothetical protein
MMTLGALSKKIGWCWGGMREGFAREEGDSRQCRTLGTLAGAGDLK